MVTLSEWLSTWTPSASAKLSQQQNQIRFVEKSKTSMWPMHNRSHLVKGRRGGSPRAALNSSHRVTVSPHRSRQARTTLLRSACMGTRHASCASGSLLRGTSGTHIRPPCEDDACRSQTGRTTKTCQDCASGYFLTRYRVGWREQVLLLH